MKIDVRNVLRINAIALIAVLTATQTCFAADVSFDIGGQDAAAQAAQQAISMQQTAMQQAQQANQQAMQDAQQANQNAMQASQSAMQAGGSTGFSTSQPHPQTITSALTGGPIPEKIATAHTVYFQNDGTDPGFPMDETVAVHDVFTALQGWGHYQLVDNPNQADLIFVLHNAAPISGEWTDGDGNSYTFTSPTFVLNIVDAKTNANLWTVTSLVPVRGSGKKEAAWFTLGVQNLISRLKVVVGQPLTTDEQADLTKAPQTHYGRNAIIITGAVLGVGVAGGLIMHHEFENSVNNMNKQSQQWCIANGFPIVDCTV